MILVDVFLLFIILYTHNHDTEPHTTNIVIKDRISEDYFTDCLTGTISILFHTSMYHRYCFVYMDIMIVSA